MANELGKVRRSTLAMTNGPGAVVDFRDTYGAPISAVVCGLDEWDCGERTHAVNCLQSIEETRLSHSLNLRDGLLQPPVFDESLGGRRGQNDRDPGGRGYGASNRTRRTEQVSLKAARFPGWLQCPRCDMIGPERAWDGYDDAGIAHPLRRLQSAGRTQARPSP